MLVVVEGIDGSGKSSVVEALSSVTGIPHMSFPNDAGYTGPMIRSYLRKEWLVEPQPRKTPEGFPLASAPLDAEASALAFQALQVANRMEVMPRLQQARLCPYSKESMILARYWQSGWVYGKLDGLDPDWLIRVHAGMAQAHVNILLDLPAEEAMRRRAARDGELPCERYEGRRDFTEKVAALYRELWNRPDPSEGEWVIVNANQPLHAVMTDCLAAIG
jgi:thymidylate kinase